VRTAKIVLVLLLLALLFSGCKATDTYWSFPVTRTTGLWMFTPKGLKADTAEEAAIGLAICVLTPFIPVMIDLALLPITLPRDLWVAYCGPESVEPDRAKEFRNEAEDRKCTRSLQLLHACLLRYRLEGKALFPRRTGPENLRVLLDYARDVDASLKRNVFDEPTLQSRFVAAGNLPGTPSCVESLLETQGSPLSVPVVWERDLESRGYRHVLFLDGHVEIVSDDLFAREFPWAGQ